MGEKLVVIKRDEEKRLKPRDSCDWFKEHREEWYKLKWGEEVEVPEGILPELVNVLVVKKKKSKGGEE